MKVANSLLAILGSCIPLASAATAFSYDFQISNLVVDSPFQYNFTSAANSTVSFDWFDQDTPTVPAAHCVCKWKVGLTPDQGTAACDNSTFIFSIPGEAYQGVQNFQINLRHTYRDHSVGDYPYNFNTKISALNLAYPNTTKYECDLSSAHCNSCEGTVLIALVTMAIA